jgi:hypothetical protein
MRALYFSPSQIELKLKNDGTTGVRVFPPDWRWPTWFKLIPFPVVIPTSPWFGRDKISVR